MKIEDVSQVEHDALCTGVTYNPWTLRRLPCDQPVYKTLGYDGRSEKAFRFCRWHWDQFERAIRRDVVMSHEPEWQWVRDQVIRTSAARILATVLKDGAVRRKRREAGLQNVAQVVEAGAGVKSIVYFIQSGDTGPIKIGTTRNVWARFSELQVGSPMPLHLRAFQHGDRKVEQEYHDRFHEHRLGGEWFEPVPSLLATIDALQP